MSFVLADLLDIALIFHIGKRGKRFIKFAFFERSCGIDGSSQSILNYSVFLSAFILTVYRCDVQPAARGAADEGL